MRSPLGIWGSIIGFVLASATVLHTLFATHINAVGGLNFLHRPNRSLLPAKTPPRTESQSRERRH